MRTSDETKDLVAAMVKVQGTMKPAIKDAENPHYRSKYADLSAIWDACREPLAANGLTVWQDVTTGEKGVEVVTRLSHTSGQWVEFGPLGIPMGKQDAHSVGSATSYGKRYGLAAALGVVTDDDDDGNAASGAKRDTKPAKREEGGNGSPPKSQESERPFGVNEHGQHIVPGTPGNQKTWNGLGGTTLEDPRVTVNLLGEMLTFYEKNPKRQDFARAIENELERRREAADVEASQRDLNKKPPQLDDALEREGEQLFGPRKKVTV